MEITVLGSDGMYAGPRGATSGYVVRHDGFALLMDLGSGTLAELQEHLPFDEANAILISHRHPDHLVDLFGLFIARLYGRPEPLPPIPLLGPADALERMNAFVAEGGEAGLERAFSLHPLEPGATFEAGPIRVRTAAMAHVVPTLGYRVEADGAALAYSADTGPTADLVDLAKGSDVLVAEASWQDDGREYPPDLHLRASEAGHHAQEAEVGSLVLTHFKPGLDRSRSVQEASAAFGGSVVEGKQGLTLEVEA